MGYTITVIIAHTKLPSQKLVQNIQLWNIQSFINSKSEICNILMENTKNMQGIIIQKFSCLIFNITIKIIVHAVKIKVSF